MIKRDLNLFEVISENKGYKPYEKEYLKLGDRFKTTSADIHDIGQLITLGFNYDDKYIIPEYQRDLVWSLEQKQNLIKSILYGNTIGDFLFKKEYGLDSKGNRNSCEVHWSVIDGQQRINAIREFFLNKFTIDGKYFKDLKYWDARGFLDTEVKATTIQGITLEEEINIYLNRNCGGTMHTQEELNKAKEFLQNEINSLNDL